MQRHTKWFDDENNYRIPVRRVFAHYNEGIVMKNIGCGLCNNRDSLHVINVVQHSSTAHQTASRKRYRLHKISCRPGFAFFWADVSKVVS